ncbi:hypothetical protein XELAEV_18004508mg [Xenopus laevis]|uniref:Uncharacterized protein n=1 Tax=Xenopus laevis TaxID=8355 RepID=A0A974GZN5_XENLA|nr:hypothetical protein XELAEV_18004508mg [Xenopus laevis]
MGGMDAAPLSRGPERPMLQLISLCPPCFLTQSKLYLLFPGDQVYRYTVLFSYSPCLYQGCTNYGPRSIFNWPVALPCARSLSLPLLLLAARGTGQAADITALRQDTGRWREAKRGGTVGRAVGKEMLRRECAHLRSEGKKESTSTAATFNLKQICVSGPCPCPCGIAFAPALFHD